MIFLQPWALWFLAGVPVIVLLYLLKLKRQQATVSTLLFWQRLLQENRRRALFQRLRNLFSLLLHLLIFALILAALAKPTSDTGVRAGASLVIVLDTRARMQAVERDGRTRFAHACEIAANFAKQASAGREVAIVVAGATPTVLAPFSGDEKRLRETVESLDATDATGDLHAALLLAKNLLAARHGERRVVVLTAPGSGELTIAGAQVDVLPVGDPHDNVAITRFATRPLPNSPQTSEVLLELRNFGREPASGNIELRYDGALLDVKPVALEPGGRHLDVFPSVPRPSRSARGWLTAHLDTADALALDNTARAILPPPKARRVLLVSAGNWFLEKLLAADPTVSFELIAPEAWQPAFASKFGVVIFDEFVPPDLNLDALGTNVLFIGKTPFTAAGEPDVQPVVTDTDARHPLLRLIDFGGVTFLRAAPLAIPGESTWRFEAPLRSFDHPLLITGEARPYRLVALAFGVADSDLPLRIAFPLLMTNTLQWLSGESDEAPLALSAGESLALAADESIDAAPAAETGPAVVDPPRSSGVFKPLRQGFYERHRAIGADWIAVNTFSESESDLRVGESGARSPEKVLSNRTPPLRELAGWPFWRYLALGAVALIAVEWSLFHRRRTE